MEFQDDISMPHIYKRTNRNQYAPHFFKVGGRKRKVHIILPVMIRRPFSLLQTIEGINFGLVIMYVTLDRISWIIFTLDLVQNYTNS